MRCDAFERWLDEGMPEADAAEALAHARDCARCAAALSAAESVEAALRMRPPDAPAGFTAGVMARLTAEAARPAPAPRRAPWWLEIAAEPAVWVGLGLIPAVAAAAAITAGFGRAAAGVVEAAASAWVAASSLWATRLPSFLPPLDPTSRVAIAAALALPVLWFLYRAPIWLAESWTRPARTSPRARGSHPGSPR